MSEQINEAPQAAADRLKDTGLFDAQPVGPDTVSAISIMGDHEQLAGNVLRRLCSLGRVAEKDCAASCKLNEIRMEKAHLANEAKCADDNLSEIVVKLGIKPENVFMVGVTANAVGFADEVDTKPEKYPYNLNEKTGIKELAGLNSFWAAEGDNIAGSEVTALGRRLADCGDINVEYTNQDGKRVMGFMHLTRTNLEGNGWHQNIRNGSNYEEPSYRYFLNSAFDHYGVPDIDKGIDVRIGAAIKREHFVYKFSTQAKLQEMFPGWNDVETPFTPARQLVFNRDNPDWKPGEPFSPDDSFEIDFRGMVEWQIRQFVTASHLTRVNGRPLETGPIDWDGVIDPGDAGSQHASNHRAMLGDESAQGRDAYFTAWADKLS